MFASARVAPREFVGNTTPLRHRDRVTITTLSKPDVRATNFFRRPRKIRTSSDKNVTALREKKKKGKKKKSRKKKNSSESLFPHLRVC